MSAANVLCKVEADCGTEQHRARTQYAYPPSPSSSDDSDLPGDAAPPLSHRLRMLKAELAALETELEDPSNPLLHRKDDPGYVDPGELMRGLVDVKGRLQKISKDKEGRGRLVSIVMDDGDEAEPAHSKLDVPKAAGEEKQGDIRDIAELDQRVGELEALVGSSSTTLDEVNISSFRSLPRLIHSPLAFTVTATTFTPPHTSKYTTHGLDTTTAH